MSDSQIPDWQNPDDKEMYYGSQSEQARLDSEVNQALDQDPRQSQGWQNPDDKQMYYGADSERDHTMAQDAQRLGYDFKEEYEKDLADIHNQPPDPDWNKNKVEDPMETELRRGLQ